MRIGLLNGGLGNQLFQYIFVRFAERMNSNELWFFDDSPFFFKETEFRDGNGFELEKIFGVKLNLLSRYFDQDVWTEIISLRKSGSSLPQIFLNMGLPLSVVAETSDFFYTGETIWTPANEFHPEILQIQKPNMYYHGYWINKHWFAQYREENLAELAFPPLTDKYNLKLSDRINSCQSIGIHIRRGDFLSIGWALPTEYYQNSCRKVLDMCPDAHFFVFTDEPDWCKANEAELGLNLASHTTYVQGNVNGKNYIDAQLLSMCQGIVMSNSSFCYFATLMNKNLKFWINPTQREV